jgi:hypothetical protein
VEVGGGGREETRPVEVEGALAQVRDERVPVDEACLSEEDGVEAEAVDEGEADLGEGEETLERLPVWGGERGLGQEVNAETAGYRLVEVRRPERGAVLGEVQELVEDGGPEQAVDGLRAKLSWGRAELGEDRRRRAEERLEAAEKRRWIELAEAEGALEPTLPERSGAWSTWRFVGLLEGREAVREGVRETLERA